MKSEATWKNRERVVGVYRILCVPTGKSYIGASTDVLRRIKDHFIHMRGKFPEYPIDYDAQKYGIESMKAEILDVLNDPADLAAWEKYWIEQFDSVNNGYNHQDAGNNRHWKQHG
jgi:group I intron endonuclease